jgi:aminocarboxymuconate-semialdehyde decarboxylase
VTGTGVTAGAGLVVDVHAHALPIGLVRALERAGQADLARAAEGVLVLPSEVSGLAPGAPIPFSAEHYDLGVRLECMDRDGVDMQAVSAPPFVAAAPSSDDAFALDLARRSNDALADFVAGSPRLVGLGTVPVTRPGALEEALRCLEDLNFSGLTIGTSAGGRELDDPRNEEVWAFLAERQSFVLVHPTGAPGSERLGQFHLVQLLGFPAETALALARLVFAGVLDRHDLVLCLAHGGGCLSSVWGRLDLGWRRKSVAHTVPQPPSDYLATLHYDTAVFDRVVLGALVDRVGADHVVLGTDTPFDLADRHPRRTVHELGLTPLANRAILGENACRLLRVASLTEGTGPRQPSERHR